ncbi:Rha family transcriptional regulator [Alicyclobacillus macrosporangiidus]|uniref:Phage regulatory protein, rha family n=1 Tax=Alicyclobacillus macrosporangiidus TaxID=392015 RepID=A0A1I7IAS5_9BACL|nr:Rha family transcriptional regulator [Alicyclobacillus macrosporangiidus]SFU70037.1 phage regulatory protein, rha family [Alicyclobacillus macrosporangiidus]
MNQLVFIHQDRPVTDSLTVATVFGKEHRRVLQDIRELGCSDEFREHNFVLTSYIDQWNREKPKYIMTEQGFALLVMGYTGPRAMEFKERYIAEFERMRKELQTRDLVERFNLPRTYPEALRALAAAAEEAEQMRQQLEEQAPKVALYEVAMQATNAQAMSAIAKSLGIGRNKLFAFLREQKVLRHNNEPYQEYIDRGYFRVRQYSITHFHDGIENKAQTLVTAKGMDFIHRLLRQHGMIKDAQAVKAE